MPLTILNVAYPCAQVGPNAVGGSEQIIAALDRGLTQAGHRSIVVARSGSRVTGTLLGTHIPEGRLTPDVHAAAVAEQQRNIDWALHQFPVDLVHLHGIDCDEYRIPEAVPTLVTLHLAASVYAPMLWSRSRWHLQCVSYSQRQELPAAWRNAPVISNGAFEEKRQKLHHARRNYAMALGRICPEKNFHVAMDAGKEAGTPVWIGGQPMRYREHEQYFCEQIQPRLRDGHRFLGVLKTDRKMRLLSAAKCLLIPSLAPETSSLVAMEALSAGTPVIAFPSGALPEIVEDRVTGFLVANQHEMVSAIQHIRAISSARCLEEAKKRFSRGRMVAQYLALYSSLVGKKPQTRPRLNYPSA